MFIESVKSAMQTAADYIDSAGDDWTDTIRHASFRGVEFIVLESKLAAGRRVNNIELPYSKKNIIQDMGQKARLLTVSAFVCGRDYMVRRDQLLNALETEGLGNLVDPFRGEFQAVGWCDESESAANGGLAAFSLNFVLAPAERAEADDFDYGGNVLDEVNELISATSEEIADFIETAGKPAHVLNDTIAKLQGEIDLALTRLQAAADSVRSEWTALADRVSGLLSVSSDDAAALAAAVKNVPTLRDAQKLASRERRTPVARAETPSEITSRDNQLAIDRFFTRNYLARAAALAVDTDFEDVSSALSIRDALCQPLLTLGEVKLAVALYQYCTYQAARLPYLIEVTPDGRTSALQMAYRYYADASRADEIVSRNRLPHKLFIPAKPILILSE